MYTSMGRDEFQDATRMAQEDERRMGVLPTANRVELVSKYLCVHYIRSCTATLLLTSCRRVLVCVRVNRRRLNLRTYHLRGRFGTLYEWFVERVWWFESVRFAGVCGWHVQRFLTGSGSSLLSLGVQRKCC